MKSTDHSRETAAEEPTRIEAPRSFDEPTLLDDRGTRETWQLTMSERHWVESGDILYVEDSVEEVEHTAVVVVADHGEGLKLERELTHGFLLEEGVLQVPFLVREPGRAAETLEEPVSCVDV